MHTKQYISARIPTPIYLTLKKQAEEREITFTDILIEALERYIGGNIIGVCSGCHTKNSPDSRFCSLCGLPLDEEVNTNRINELEKHIEDMRRRIELIETYPSEFKIINRKALEDKNKKSG